MPNLETVEKGTEGPGKVWKRVEGTGTVRNYLAHTSIEGVYKELDMMSYHKNETGSPEEKREPIPEPRP